MLVDQHLGVVLSEYLRVYMDPHQTAISESYLFAYQHRLGMWWEIRSRAQVYTKFRVNRYQSLIRFSADDILIIFQETGKLFPNVIIYMTVQSLSSRKENKKTKFKMSSAEISWAGSRARKHTLWHKTRNARKKKSTNGIFGLVWSLTAQPTLLSHVDPVCSPNHTFPGQA